MSSITSPITALITALLLVFATSVSASTFRYDYFAATTFDTFLTDAGYPASNPFDTSNAVSGYFEVDDALAANTTFDFFLDSTPDGFFYSFSDGLNSTTFNDAFDYFTLRTDANGDIVEWFIYVFAPSAVGGDFAAISTANCANACGFSIMRDEGLISVSGNTAIGRVFDNPGTWSVTEIPAPVPVPAAVWLFASGLIGLVGVARRKRA